MPMMYLDFRVLDYNIFKIIRRCIIILPTFLFSTLISKNKFQTNIYNIKIQID